MSRLRASREGKTLVTLLLIALLLGLALMAAACADEDAEEETVTTDEDTEATETTEEEGAEEDGAEEDGEEMGGTIRIGWIPWDEDVAVTYLWKDILENEGFTVELTQLDVAPVYQGVAEGDLDLFLDSWLPVTHEDYWDEFGDQLEDIKVWYDNASLTWAVPDYLDDINSVEDLEGNADMFGGQVIGIEPGAGLMRLSRENVIPQYNLGDEYTLVEGSTPAMLAELERATNNEEPVVVTLWHPHWAYSAFPIKDLEDPQGALGEAETIHAVARDGFSDDFPQVAEWLSNFEMSDEALASLEELVINEYGEGEEEEAVEEWLSDSENQDLVDSWLSG